MDFELENHQFQEPERKTGRQKTSLRLKYEAEARVIRERYGGLESIRKTLGFSQRKMGQLLLVDPSAWSRWVKDESKVPPHIYRSLEWLLLLQDKNPDLVRVVSQGLLGPSANSKELNEKLQFMEHEIEALKRQKMVEISRVMLVLMGLFVFALFYILIG